ncbi:MAG: 2-amino-4-hydroxy-6-hydroxymethyldihydropteridine diphosphokinase [Spirochaetales bacterium]|nr:2-amino-4-hydroxy-6-hydroxymethyldihydropteridine diphosphokinase [Spirochaetales bacterium]
MSDFEVHPLFKVGIGLGSNLGESKDILRRATQELRSSIREMTVSSLYETDPREYREQPNYFNCAVVGYWSGSFFQLLDFCQTIENREGRIRKKDFRYGPRTLDLDILWADYFSLKGPNLTVPHPRLLERAFALIPLLELEPDAIEPQTQRFLSEYRQTLENQGVYQVEW